MKKIILSIGITISTLFLSGCLLTSAISTAITVANERRTAGEIVDDKNIKLSLLSWSAQDAIIQDAHINFMVYKKAVLITGEAPTRQIFDYIGKKALTADFKITSIINEMQITENSSLLNRIKDTAITAKITLFFQNQEVFNPTHINATTENKTVYLMGDVTMREANMATKIVSTISGVKRIVKFFNYLRNLPAAEIEAAKQREIEAKEQKIRAEKKAEIEAKKAELRRQIRALDPDAGTNFSPE